jgi:hypothetical protein
VKKDFKVGKSYNWVELGHKITSNRLVNRYTIYNQFEMPYQLSLNQKLIFEQDKIKEDSYIEIKKRFSNAFSLSSKVDHRINELSRIQVEGKYYEHSIRLNKPLNNSGWFIETKNFKKFSYFDLGLLSNLHHDGSWGLVFSGIWKSNFGVLRTNLNFNSKKEFYTQLSINFGIQTNPLRFYREPLTQKGLIEVTVAQKDSNGESIGISGIRLKNHPTPSNALGKIFLQSYGDLMEVEIDPTSLPDIFMKSDPGKEVETIPGSIQYVDFYIHSLGEIEGSADSGSIVVLMDSAGNTIQKIRAQFDGWFLFESIPYGSYYVKNQTLVYPVTLDKKTPSGQVNFPQTTETS